VWSFGSFAIGFVNNILFKLLSVESSFGFFLEALCFTFLLFFDFTLAGGTVVEELFNSFVSSINVVHNMLFSRFFRSFRSRTGVMELLILVVFLCSHFVKLSVIYVIKLCESIVKNYFVWLAYCGFLRKSVDSKKEFFFFFIITIVIKMIDK